MDCVIAFISLPKSFVPNHWIVNPCTLLSLGKVTICRICFTNIYIINVSHPIGTYFILKSASGTLSGGNTLVYYPSSHGFCYYLYGDMAGAATDVT